MKRLVLISMMVLLAVAGAWAQDLGEFQDGFNTFADALAPTLSYNATIGNNWSDAYIGKFPHLGVGVAVGFTSVDIMKMDSLLEAMGIDALPDAIKEIGLPMPAAALSAKLGGFILPFDIGLKAMLLPESITTSLSALGYTLDYTLFGGNVRYAVLKENILLPDVSIGAGYNRLSGSLGMVLDTTLPTYTVGTYTLKATDPKLALSWTTDSYDFTLQVSKNLLFIRPYAGVGYSIGKSSVSGGLSSSITDQNDVPLSAADLEAINAALTMTGMDVPNISADGILFGKDSTEPALRVYGGVSLALIIVHIDTSVIYVPATKSLGGSVMLRVQL